MKTIRNNKGALLISLIELAVGILLLIDHLKFTTAILIIGGIALLVSAIASIIHYFRTDVTEAVLEHDLSRGLILLSAGLFCIFGRAWIIATFPLLTVLYGIAALMAGFVKLEGTFSLMRLKVRGWQLAGLNALLTVAFAAVVLLNPFKATETLLVFLAIALIVVAVLDVVAVFVSGRDAA